MLLSSMPPASRVDAVEITPVSLIQNDVVDVYKIEAGRLELVTRDFDLHEPVESTVEHFAVQARTKGLEIVVWIDDDVPVQVHGDAGRLRQVLTNLVDNAVKFTDSGEVVVRITKAAETPSKVVLRFAVRDTGIGISDTALPDLFEKPIQAQVSAVSKGKRAGLGLTLVKRLVIAMGGDFGVTSQAGEGATFWFMLPLEKQQATAHKAPRADLQGLRVLIVDPNASLRCMLRDRTVSLGMTPAMAASVTDGLRILQRAAATGDRFDVIILDAYLSEQEGAALAEAVEQDPVLGTTPLVWMSFLGENTYGEPPERLPRTARLVKPVQPSLLFDCLFAATNDVHDLVVWPWSISA